MTKHPNNRLARRLAKARKNEEEKKKRGEAGSIRFKLAKTQEEESLHELHNPDLN